MNKQVIAENFSRSAATYDIHAAVQKMCAEQLMDFVGGRRFSRILEIGCGTGVYTRLLRDEHKDAEITAVDISEDMIEAARRKFPDGDIRFRVADGEQIEENNKHDLITSNASFQWFKDIEAALDRFTKALTGDGVICFSMYGPGTFKEFREVLGASIDSECELTSRKFISREKLDTILRRQFTEYKLREEFFEVKYPSLWGFLKNIKHCGARGEGLGGNVFLGKDRIKELENKYIDEFGGITATHHVYFCEARI